MGSRHHAPGRPHCKSGYTELLARPYVRVQSCPLGHSSFRSRVSIGCFSQVRPTGLLIKRWTQSSAPFPSLEVSLIPLAPGPSPLTAGLGFLSLLLRHPIPEPSPNLLVYTNHHGPQRTTQTSLFPRPFQGCGVTSRSQRPAQSFIMQDVPLNFESYIDILPFSNTT